MKRVLGILNCAAVFILAASGSVSAAGLGCIPIGAPTVLDGSVASISGSYCVTSTITASVTIIEIRGTGSESIEIDLAGFSLDGDSSDVVFASNLDSLTIHSGSISLSGGLGRGVYVESTRQVVVEQLLLRDGLSGIELSGVPRFTIRDNQISSTNGDGIAVDGSPAPVRVSGAIARNSVTAPAGYGIAVRNNNAAVKVAGNEVISAGQGAGIYLLDGRGCVVDANSVTGSGLGGILLEQMLGCLVVENSTTNNDATGITLRASNDTAVRRNISTNNGGNGLQVEGDNNVIRGNLLSSNSDIGLHFASVADGNIFANNTSRLNAGSPVCPAVACGAAPDFCDHGAGNGSAGGNVIPALPPC